MQHRSRLERILELAEELSDSSDMRPRIPELCSNKDDKRKMIEVLDVIIALVSKNGTAVHKVNE